MRTPWLLIGITLAYATWTLWTAPAWTVDDAYILFRYARNWATTGIPTWNPGEPPVEGYTGTLYLALLTGAYRLGLPLEQTAKALGIGSFAAAGLFLWLLLHRLGVRPGLRAGALLLYGTAAFLFPHALSGLETMLVVALLTGALWLTVRALHLQRSSAAIVAVAALLPLALVRPEGLLFAGALLLGLLVRGGNDRALMSLRGLRLWKAPAPFWIALLVLFVLPVAAVTLWRWQLYGELVPNTYVAKRADSFGFAELLSFLEFALQYWAIALCLLLLWAIAEWEGWTALLRAHLARFFPLGLSLLGATAILLLEYSRSTLQMNYAHRFWAMLYPMGLAVFCAGLEQGVKAVEATAQSRPVRFRRLVQLSFALLALQVCVHLGLWRWQERKFIRDYAQLLHDEHAPAAELLRRLLPDGSWIVVYPDAGLIPYRTGFPTLDGGRLSDRFLARHRWHGSAGDSVLIGYFFARQPAAFVFKSRCPERLCLNAEAAAVVADPRFAPYVLAASFRTRARRFAERYFLLVYVHRRFLPHSASAPLPPGLRKPLPE